MFWEYKWVGRECLVFKLFMLGENIILDEKIRICFWMKCEPVA